MDRKTQRRMALKLIKELESISDYNDKGVVWMKHSREQIQRTHEQFAKDLMHLRSVIGEEHLTPETRTLLESEDTLRDRTRSAASSLRSLILSNKLFVNQNTNR